MPTTVQRIRPNLIQETTLKASQKATNPIT